MKKVNGKINNQTFFICKTKHKTYICNSAVDFWARMGSKEKFKSAEGVDDSKTGYYEFEKDHRHFACNNEIEFIEYIALSNNFHLIY